MLFRGNDMSRQYSTEIECPKCKTTVKITIWNSLNVSLEPDAKNALLKGNINLFQCSNCNYNAYIAVPLLYHDMDNEFCVQYYPFECFDDDGFFDNFLPDGRINIDIPEERLDHMKYMNDIHIVFNMHELVQYVIFRDKLREAKKSRETDI
jgi:hypothetical protein